MSVVSDMRGIENARCPFCNHHVPCATTPPGMKRTKPKDGDTALCIACGEWAVYDSRLKTVLRKPTFVEYSEFVMNPIMQDMRTAWVMMNEEEGGGAK